MKYVNCSIFLSWSAITVYSVFFFLQNVMHTKKLTTSKSMNSKRLDMVWYLHYWPSLTSFSLISSSTIRSQTILVCPRFRFPSKSKVTLEIFAVSVYDHIRMFLQGRDFLYWEHPLLSIQKWFYVYYTSYILKH